MQAIPLSVDLWIHYLGFIKAVQGEGTEGTETIRRLTLPYTEYYIPLSFMTLKSLPSVLGSPKVEQKCFSSERAWDHGANVGSLYDLMWQSLFQPRAQICLTSV